MSDPDEKAFTDELNERLTMLLVGVANGLKGEPEPLTAHSWHDLPSLARAMSIDAVNLAHALRLVINANIYQKVNDEQARKEIAESAIAAGLALGAHDKLFEALK